MVAPSPSAAATASLAGGRSTGDHGFFLLRHGPSMLASLATALPEPSTMASLAAYLAVIAAAAFSGGSSIAFLSLGHRRMQVVVTLTAGVMLGVGLLHLLPHAHLELAGSIEATTGWVLAGFLLMFLLERAFHGHAHHAADGSHVGHGCEHDHAHAAGDTPHAARWAWCGAFAGLALHSLVDGAALAASVGADADHGAGLLAGFATFLAIVLHKPLDAGIIATLMINSGVSARTRRFVNALYALVVPLGAVAFLASLRLFGGDQSPVLGARAPSSASRQPTCCPRSSSTAMTGCC
ncbi:MAG: hypothetical protein EBZ59_10030 [Planctomycetia bacterium]|nr:hypothetical protein [Planctomycetia bacterium]